MDVSEIISSDFTSSDANYGIEILITVLVMFLFGCVGGYFLEVLFRRFITAKKWVNPGFMRGPWLPLYGFGLVIMFFMCAIIMLFMPSSLKFYNPLGDLWGISYQSGPTWADLIPILLMGLAMNLLEFVAGVIFVKGFKVRLWDYTNMKGNIMGVVCPLFGLIWLVVAILYYYVVNPFAYIAFKNTFSYIFGTDSTSSNVVHVGLIFLIGMVYGIMLIDFIKSADVFNKVSKFANEKGIVAKYEKFREEQKKQKQTYKEKLTSALPDLFIKKDNSKFNEVKETVAGNVKKMIFIDPDKKDTSGNYDENGRPKKDEDEDKGI